MRELVYFVACTVDGFIARLDGSFDCFLQEGEHFADLFAEFPETLPVHLRDVLNVHAPNRHFDTVLMGRNTYEVGTRLGVTNPYPHLTQYLFTRTRFVTPDPAVQLVCGDPLEFVRSLKSQPGMKIWICGGSQLATALLPEIDELILKINPILIGSGIPLFSSPVDTLPLALTERKTYSSGVVRAHYRLRPSP